MLDVINIHKIWSKVNVVTALLSFDLYYTYKC